MTARFHYPERPTIWLSNFLQSHRKIRKRRKEKKAKAKEKEKEKAKNENKSDNCTVAMLLCNAAYTGSLFYLALDPLLNKAGRYRRAVKT